MKQSVRRRKVYKRMLRNHMMTILRAFRKAMANVRKYFFKSLDSFNVDTYVPILKHKLPPKEF